MPPTGIKVFKGSHLDFVVVTDIFCTEYMIFDE